MSNFFFFGQPGSVCVGRGSEQSFPICFFCVSQDFMDLCCLFSRLNSSGMFRCFPYGRHFMFLIALATLVLPFPKQKNSKQPHNINNKKLEQPFLNFSWYNFPSIFRFHCYGDCFYCWLFPIWNMEQHVHDGEEEN